MWKVTRSRSGRGRSPKTRSAGTGLMFHSLSSAFLSDFDREVGSVQQQNRSADKRTETIHADFIQWR